jgi:hypothetical protein
MIPVANAPASTNSATASTSECAAGASARHTFSNAIEPWDIWRAIQIKFANFYVIEITCYFAR